MEEVLSVAAATGQLGGLKCVKQGRTKWEQLSDGEGRISKEEGEDVVREGWPCRDHAVSLAATFCLRAIRPSWRPAVALCAGCHHDAHTHAHGCPCRVRFAGVQSHAPPAHMSCRPVHHCVNAATPRTPATHHRMLTSALPLPPMCPR